MKIKQRLKDALGISLIVSAFSLCITFIVLSFKKKSIWGAILALAAAEGAVGSYLLLDNVWQKGSAKASPTEEDLLEAEGEELFDAEESVAAELRVRSVLGGKQEGEVAASPSVRREIPRDEEATEADFA